MKTNLKRVLSFVLVMMLVLSCVPTMAFAAEDTHTHAAQNITTGAEYDSLAEAMEAAASGDTVKVLSDSNEAVTYSEGVILDLNGHNVSNITVPADITLTAIDSATDDYAGGFGTLSGNIAGTVASTVKTAEPKSYVSINDNGSWSFHRYYAAITAISLKPGSAALGYKAEFYGDEAVKNAVVNYGYEMWLNDYAPKALSKADKLEKNVLTLRVSNILKEGNDALNAIGSTASINGKAFITLNLNGETVTLYSAEKTTTLRGTIEAINANVAAYSETALQAVRNLCTTYAAWMIGWATENIFGVSAGEGDLNVEVIVPITAENNVLSEDAVLSYQNIVATVPAGAVLADGANELKLTIVDKASSDSDVEKQVDEALRPLDVHIEGISADNTAPIIICLGNVLPKGLNIGNYDLYHVEDGKTVAMTRANSLSELDAHNEFCYDPATGAVTVAVCSFSEITLTSKAAKWAGGVDHSWYTANPNADQNTYCIYNADQLNSFAQIVGGMVGDIAQDSFSGKTVILHADLDLDDLDSENGRVFYPIGYWNNTGSFEHISGGSVSSGFYSFDGTFDGNGHTISNFYQNTWEMFGDYNDGYSGTPNYYRDGMGLFGKVYGGTVKNLTVKKFSSDGEFTTTGTIAAYADCGAKFENISIFNCNPRVYNIGNGGIVGCVGWYAKETVNTPVTFTNITVDNSNKISALWGSWDVACGGLVGQYYPTSGQSSANYPANAGIHMENCHVAAQIDVNNDVCANYQYYAYRYAGMLIGSVRENVNGDGSALYPNTGRVYPNMNGITAENCTVHYGTWNDYYYCELVANSLASYTHDHQFSRLTQVADVDTSTLKYLPLGATEYLDIPSGRVNYVVVTGEHATENAKCYHFVDGQVWNHANAGYEDLDKDGNKETLIENNQHIYLEFYDQLVTGYGWGVTSMGIADVPGVTVLDRNVADSIMKFGIATTAKSKYFVDTTLTIGELFTAINQTNDPIDVANVRVFVSPADETSTVRATYVADTTDWTKGTLAFQGSGAATITITDYNYCIATVLSVTIEPVYVVKFSVSKEGNPVDPMTVDRETCSITLPDAEDVEIEEDGDNVSYTFLGWSTTNISPTTEQPVLLNAGDTLVVQKNTLLYAVYQYKALPSEYVLTEAADIDSSDKVVITMTTVDNTTYVLTNNYSTISAPYADTIKLITLDGETKLASAPFSNALWNVSYNNGEMIIYVDGDTTEWLYSTNSNDGVRVGTNTNNVFTINGGYLYNTATERYFGVYRMGEQWRSYEVTTGNIKDQVIGLYVKRADGVMTDHYTTLQSDCSHVNTYVEGYVAPTCNTVGSTGNTICMDCGFVVETSQEINYLSHPFNANGICTVCGKIGYTLVTDISQLNIDDEIVIVANNDSYNFAISTVQNKNNRGAAVIIRDNNNQTVTATDDTLQVLLLKQGSVSGTYAFYTGSGYLYSDGTGPDGDNTLKTKNSVDSYSSWTITIDADGVATISGNGGNTRNNLKFNASSTLFASYTGGQEPVRLYKRSLTACDHTGYETTTNTVPATCTQAGSVDTICINCGQVVSSEVIEKLAHTEVVDAAVDPTCTETGLTEGKHCSVCGEVTVAQEEIPAKGHSWNGGEVTTEPTCTTEGVKTYTCTACGETKTESVAMLDHTYVGGTCSVCGAAEDTLAGTYYIATIRTSGNYWYMTSDLGTASTKRYQAVDSGLTTLPEEITDPVDSQVFVIEKNDDGTYSIYAQGITDDERYLGYTSGNSGTLVAQSSALKLKIDEAYNIHFTASDAERYLALNNNSGQNYFAWYKSGQKQDLYLIPVNECDHVWGNWVQTTAPGCETAGENTRTCSVCGATETQSIDATGHNYVDGICSNCDEEDPNASTGFAKATSISIGDIVVFVSESASQEMTSISTTSTKYGIGTTYANTPNGTWTFTVVQGSTSGSVAFKDNNGYYLTWSSGNSLTTSKTLNANSSWTVSFSGGNAVIKNVATNTRQIYWNNSSPRFACYTSSEQQPIQLYKNS